MMKFYLAYGSNLNREQMASRCPDAVPVCTWFLEDYQLIFRRGVATIEPAKGFHVPVAIWKISQRDEQNLDKYEGFPRLYTKEHFFFRTPDGEEHMAMGYVMTPGKMVSMPYAGYLHTIYAGYKDFDLDRDILLEAVIRTGELEGTRC